MRAEWAAGAGGAEVGFGGVAVVATDRADRDGDAGRAGCCGGVEIDGELVLGEDSGGRGGRLDLRLDVDVVGVQVGQDRSGAVGGVTVDRRVTVDPGRRASTGDLGRVTVDRRVTGGCGVGEVGDQLVAGCASPMLPAVTVVAVMISLSGSTAMCPL